LIDEAVGDGLIDKTTVRAERGRPKIMLSLTQAGESELDGEDLQSGWRDEKLFIADARVNDPYDEVLHPGYVLEFADYVAANFDIDEWAPLREVLERAPKSWSKLQRVEVIDIVRVAWLKFGMIECTFAPRDGEWFITISPQGHARVRTHVGAIEGLGANGQNRLSRWQ
jgi:hypothetical protein